MKTVELGCEVKDKVTGFKGVVTGIVHYLTGCDQALVGPKVDSKGKLQDSAWFDVQRLDVTSEKKIVLDNSKTPGFDLEPPKY